MLTQVFHLQNLIFFLNILVSNPLNVYYAELCIKWNQCASKTDTWGVSDPKLLAATYLLHCDLAYFLELLFLHMKYATSVLVK